MRKEPIKREIFLEELPKKGKVIDWKNSVGFKVKFIYDDIEGEVDIIEYKQKNEGYIIIRYENKEREIRVSMFSNCAIGEILEKTTNDFKIEIGYTIKDDNRDITIIDRKKVKEKRIDKLNRKSIAKLKYYKIRCNKCGFDGGEHYNAKSGEYQKEHWIYESHLNGGRGCPCCCPSPQVLVQGINDISTTDPWMIKFFQNPDDAKLYTKSSNKKIKPVCPNCGRIKDKEITINNIYKRKSIGCSCGDAFSYPEKFMFSVLEQLGVNFITQLNKTMLDWCDNYRYDFYVKSTNTIIETHGEQHPNTKHYRNGFESLSKKTYDDEFQNDINKKNLAIENGIKESNYIVIDCSKSDMEFIKNEILNSKLNELFDLSTIDWNMASDFALSSLVKKVCEIKMVYPDATTMEISEITKINRSTIIKYLKQGSKIWDWINYNPKEERIKSTIKNGKSNGKTVEIFKDEQSLGVFESCAELERQSEEMFGIKLNKTSVSEVCIGKRSLYKGFAFKYVNQETKENQTNKKSA